MPGGRPEEPVREGSEEVPGGRPEKEPAGGDEESKEVAVGDTEVEGGRSSSSGGMR